MSEFENLAYFILFVGIVFLVVKKTDRGKNVNLQLRESVPTEMEEAQKIVHNHYHDNRTINIYSEDTQIQDLFKIQKKQLELSKKKLIE